MRDSVLAASLRCLSLGTAFLFALPGSALAQEDASDPLLGGSEEPNASTHHWFANLWLDHDRVDGLPNNRPDFDRTRARARLGLNALFGSAWEFTGSIRIAQGTDDNRDNRRNNDNERSDNFGIDQVMLRWRASEDASLQFGKAPLPLDLSAMLWDPDLRPIGVAWDQGFAVGELNRLHLTAGYFAGDHLYGDESRIGAVQLALGLHEGAPTRGRISLGFIDFSDLDELTRQGLARTNTVVAGALVNDYRLLDLQLAAHTELGSWPIDLRLDLVRNLDADAKRDGTRISLSAGDIRQPGGVVVGLALHRIQRDAVMAAFNSDDWWFHSNMHGQRGWVGYGFNEAWNLQLSGFREQRDGLDEYTHRVQLDLNADW